jgi:hypothetical protein
VLLLPLLWLVARALLGRAGALVALAVAALSPQLVRYANEVKPYSSDACVTLVLLALALVVLRRPAAGGGGRRSSPWGPSRSTSRRPRCSCSRASGPRSSPRPTCVGRRTRWPGSPARPRCGARRSSPSTSACSGPWRRMRRCGCSFLNVFLDPRSPHFREFATDALRDWLPGPFVNGDVLHPPYTTPTVALLLAVGVVASRAGTDSGRCVSPAFLCSPPSRRRRWASTRS